jgi:hypothetical protein
MLPWRSYSELSRENAGFFVAVVAIRVGSFVELAAHSAKQKMTIAFECSLSREKAD